MTDAISSATGSATLPLTSNSTSALEQRISVLEGRLVDAQKPGAKKSDSNNAALLAKQIQAAEAQVSALRQQAEHQARAQQAAAAPPDSALAVEAERQARAAARAAGAAVGTNVDTYA